MQRHCWMWHAALESYTNVQCPYTIVVHCTLGEIHIALGNKDTMVEAENIEDNRQRRRQADGINNIIKVPLDKRLFESRDGKWDLSCVCSPTRLILNCSFTAWLRVYFLDCICFGYSIVPLV